MARQALNLTAGITEFSSRMSLKSMFSQFGEVTSCWVPPVEARRKETAWVKFNTQAQAEAALAACEAGQIYLDGVKVIAEWRSSPAKTQDSRDFDAKGSNLFSSRDLMMERLRAQEKDRGDRGRGDRGDRGGRGRSRDGGRDGRDRRGRRESSRSRSKGQDKDKKKSGKKKSSSSSSSSSSSKEEPGGAAPGGVKIVRLPASAAKATEQASGLKFKEPKKSDAIEIDSD
eukprot:TRINITY_DN96411_c0_g1_i1.p1 TRINITY_DN96411_c0_g1~~TRINITY_DN96411_c0_g1_i1.p1  ORF type:complete len:229 (-),score=54.71 TRINITY_DN96411_c0_g1_i1:51-737(-)